MPQEKPLLCALVIGHKRSSPGAVNATSGVTEFEYNDALARMIEAGQRNVEIQRVYRRTWESLPQDINELNPDFTISLHCNAFNKKVSGTEVLYYHRSTKAKEIAEILQSELVQTLQLADRKTRPKSAEDRGGYLLKSVRSPCLIAEPFFIDNDKDYKLAKSKRRLLVRGYIRAIDQIGAHLASLDSGAGLVMPPGAAEQPAVLEGATEMASALLADSGGRNKRFINVPSGSILKFSTTDDNGAVTYSARVVNREAESQTFSTASIRQPSEVAVTMKDSSRYGLLLTAAFRGKDKVSGRVWVERPNGSQLEAPWAFSMNASGPGTDAVRVTCRMV